jgi:hypothetical protein
MALKKPLLSVGRQSAQPTKTSSPLSVMKEKSSPPFANGLESGAGESAVLTLSGLHCHIQPDGVNFAVLHTYTNRRHGAARMARDVYLHGCIRMQRSRSCRQVAFFNDT